MKFCYASSGTHKDLKFGMKEPKGVSYTHVKFEIDSFLGLATALIQSEKNVFFERFLAFLGHFFKIFPFK